MNVTFITGNKHKADLFARYMGREIKHQSLDLEEIQSLDLSKIIEHKARQAYELIKAPVLVEDVAFRINALNGLPGPFIKWFLESLGAEGIHALAAGFSDRSATAEVCYGYYDGKTLKLFTGKVKGEIPDKVRNGPGGFGWNPIFIPKGSDRAYAEMTEEEQAKSGLRATTVYPQLRQFLSAIDTD